MDVERTTMNYRTGSFSILKSSKKIEYWHWAVHRIQCIPFLGKLPNSGCERSDLVVERGDFLLVGSGQEEAAHLALQGVFHLHVNVIAGCLLLVVGIHTEQTFFFYARALYF